MGPIDPTTVPRIVSEPTAEENRIAKARLVLPHPRAVLNLSEIEVRTFSLPLKPLQGE
jgi:hypothetical protein